MKPILTPIEEDELLAKVELRNSLTDKKLCEGYRISRSTLRDAVERAKVRRQRSAAAAVEPAPKMALQGFAILG